MRWRWTTNAEGKRVPESNVRMVEWCAIYRRDDVLSSTCCRSDGSRTLMVGEEGFAVRVSVHTPSFLKEEGY